MRSHLDLTRRGIAPYVKTLHELRQYPGAGKPKRRHASMFGVYTFLWQMNRPQCGR